MPPVVWEEVIYVRVTDRTDSGKTSLDRSLSILDYEDPILKISI